MDASQPGQIEALHRHRAQATRRSADVRSIRSQLKRGLKSGTVELAVALENPEAQDMTVLELLGYAMIGNTGTYRGAIGKSRPGSAGKVALLLAAGAGISHFTTVGALSATRRAQLCAAVTASGYAATTQPLSAAS